MAAKKRKRSSRSTRRSRGSRRHANVQTHAGETVMELWLGRRFTPAERRRYDRIERKPDGSHSKADSDWLRALRQTRR